MKSEEVRELVRTLRECGVTRYKDGDVEMELGPEPIDPDAPSPEPSKEITHKVEELTSLLKLDDAALVDRLFPDHTPDGDPDELPS